MFSDIATDDLCPIARHSNLQEFDRNQVVFNEGETAQSIFVVAHGQIDSFWFDKSGREVIFHTSGRHDVLGLHEAADNLNRAATCISATRSALIRIPSSQGSKLLEMPEVQKSLARKARRDLRQMRENFRRSALYDLETRLACYLKDQMPTDAPPHEVQIRDNQMRIAAKVQASRTRVNTTLRKWREQGEISIKDGRITFHRSKTFWERFETEQR